MLIYLALIDSQDGKNKFAALYGAYRDLMLHTAWQILGNQKDAEDAVHEACLRIVEILEKISDPVCPKTRSLVGIIVKGKAVDLYRARKRRAGELLEEWDVPGPKETQEDTSAFSDAFSRALAKLTQRQRALLLLKYDQGFETREIAKILDLTEANTVKAIQRAKGQLRKNLKEQGVEV